MTCQNEFKVSLKNKQHISQILQPKKVFCFISLFTLKLDSSQQKTQFNSNKCCYMGTDIRNLTEKYPYLEAYLKLLVINNNNGFHDVHYETWINILKAPFM